MLSIPTLSLPSSLGLLPSLFLGLCLGLGDAEANPSPKNPLPEIDDSVQGNEIIVITGSRRPQTLSESTLATEVISRDQIERSGSENLSELLASHPGLEIRPSRRGSEVRIQGLDPKYVLVLVDGQRSIGRIGGSIDLQRFSIEDIERIEIVKGPSSAMYGSDAIAGVINIITRKNTKRLSAQLHSSMGQRGKLDLSSQLGVARNRWSSTTTLGWHLDDGYDLDPSTLDTSASTYNEKQVSQNLSYRIRDNHTVSIQGLYLIRDQAGIDQSATGATFDRSTRTELASLSLASNWESSSGNRLSGSARFGMWNDQFLQDQRLSDALDKYEQTSEKIAEIRIQHDRLVAETHVLSVGLEGLLETLKADRIIENGSRYRASLFAQHQWSLTDTLVLSPGFRADLDTQFGFHPTPKLATLWKVRPDMTLRAGYGRGFRAPNFRELLLLFENPSVGYLVQGNENLRPENSNGLNTGLEVQIVDDWWGTLNLFYNSIDNLITTDLVEVDAMGTQRFGYINVDSARTMGVESLLKTTPRKGWDFEIGYTYTNTLNRATGRPLPGRAMHRATVRSFYHLDQAFTASVRGAVYGKRSFYRNEEEIQSSPYIDLSARIAGELSEALTLFVAASNLLDAGDPELLNMPPRTIYGGMTARY